MNINKWKLIAYIVAIIGFILFGFYLGRATIDLKEPEVIIKYEKGDVIRDSIAYPVPYEVVKPIDTANIIKQCVKDGIYFDLFPEKTVVEFVEVTKEDTLKIIEDWASKRLYKETLFDIDTIGKCTVDLSVQYNRMSLIGYTYTPVSKIVTTNIYNVKNFSPFIGAGLLMIPKTDDWNFGLSIDGGLFIKEKYGLKLQYGYMLNKERNSLIGASFLYKF